MFKELFEKVFNIDIRTFNLCNNIQGFERWFGASKNNQIDVSSLEPLKVTNEWKLIVGINDLGTHFKYYDVRKINVLGIKGNTRIQFMTSDNEIFESLVSKDGYYIIDVEPAKKGTTLHARYFSETKQAVNMFISIIRI